MINIDRAIEKQTYVLQNYCTTKEDKEDIEMAIRALEKEKPADTIVIRYVAGHCPCCLMLTHEYWKYCANCGQKIVGR